MTKEKISTDISKKSSFRSFFDWLKDFIIIILIVLFVRTFLIMPFQISGQSMYDAYYDREFIIVDRFSYLDIPLIKDWNPERWDVIVFRPHVSEDKEYFIKRIIGLPWDTIKIENWKVYLQDKFTEEFVELDEWYLSQDSLNSTFVKWSRDAFIYDVPDGDYFVMWDNRNHSTDSRECFSSCIWEARTNFIKKDDIIWRLLIDLWYFNLRTFSFLHPELWIETTPKWFSSLSNYDYIN